MPQFFSPFRVQTDAKRAAANVRLNCHCETPSTMPVEKRPPANCRLNNRCRTLSSYQKISGKSLEFTLIWFNIIIVCNERTIYQGVFMIRDEIKSIDPEIYNAIEEERIRQETTIELIASENAASKNVLWACGSIMTNKYAEGYPNKRYYGGCEKVDIAESLAIERAKIIFNAEHANVQPHSGSQANMAVFMAELKPGDLIMGMDLSAGGHLTHGSKVNFSGILYNIVSYGVNPDSGYIDYEQVLRIAEEKKPKLIIAGASAYPRIIDFKKFREAADAAGALLMVDMAHIAGIVAAGLHPSPFPYADYVTTTTHKTLRGPRGGIVLCKKEHAKKLDSAIFPGIQGGPFMHIIAAKAIALKEAMDTRFKDYIKNTLKNAQTLADELTKRNFNLISGGTENHLMLIDLRNRGITGKAFETACDLVNITLNKNSVPLEPQKPSITSGVRLGSPTITTRGMSTPEITKIAEWLNLLCQNSENTAIQKQIRQEVVQLCGQFPLYQK